MVLAATLIRATSSSSIHMLKRLLGILAYTHNLRTLYGNLKKNDMDVSLMA